MAQEETAEDSKKKLSTNNEKSKVKTKETAPPSKVIIRRLPPTMNKEIFLEQVSPIPDHDYFCFVEGDPAMGQQSFSRAYINFKNQEDIFLFQEKFDGYVFVDQKGNAFTAIVEFAPYQKIPKSRENVKADDKSGTINNDPDFLDFVKKLESPEEVTLPTIENYLEQLEIKERERKANRGFVKVVTPLVEYIENKRHERDRIREEKREERRRRDLERKKARDAERMKKKERREKEKPDKQNTNKDEEKRPVKLLKNAEREKDVEKGQKPEEGEIKKDRGRRDEERRGKERPRNSERGKPPKTEKPKVPREASTKETQPGKTKKPDEGAAKPSEKTAAENREENKAEKKKEEGEVGKMSEDGAGDRKEETKEARAERKMRNKDRPAIEIYRPGVRRAATSKTEDSTSEQTASTKADVKSRTFTRSSQKK